MDERLERAYEFYLHNQEELVKKYLGKLIVIREEEVLGVYDSYSEAANATYPHYKRGTVLFQEVREDESENTVTFFSPHIVVSQ